MKNILEFDDLRHDIMYEMIHDIEERFLCNSSDLGDSFCDSDFSVDYETESSGK